EKDFQIARLGGDGKVGDSIVVEVALGHDVPIEIRVRVFDGGGIQQAELRLAVGQRCRADDGVAVRGVDERNRTCRRNTAVAARKERQGVRHVGGQGGLDHLYDGGSGGCGYRQCRRGRSACRVVHRAVRRSQKDGLI